MGELRKLKFGAVENDITPYTAGDNTVTVNAANRTIAVNTSTIATKASVTALEDKAIPSGGSAGQVLKKKTATDYDMEWGNESGGGGGGMLVTVTRTNGISGYVYTADKTFAEIRAAILNGDNVSVVLVTQYSSSWYYTLKDCDTTEANFTHTRYGINGLIEENTISILSSNSVTYNERTYDPEKPKFAAFYLINNGSRTYSDNPTGPFNVEAYVKLSNGEPEFMGGEYPFVGTAVDLESVNCRSELVYLVFGYAIADIYGNEDQKFERYELVRSEYRFISGTSDPYYASWMADFYSDNGEYPLVAYYEFRTLSQLNNNFAIKTVKVWTFLNQFSSNEEIDPNGDSTFAYRRVTYTVSPLSENWTFTLSDNSTVNKRVVVQP